MKLLVKKANGTEVAYSTNTNDLSVEKSINACGVLRFKFIGAEVVLSYEDGSTAHYEDGSTPIYLEDWELPFAMGEDVFLHNESTGDKIWGGTIHTIREVDITGGRRTWRGIEYTAKCFNAIPERVTVRDAFVNQYAGDIVTTLVNDYLSGKGVTAGTIETGIYVEAIVSSNNKVSEILDTLIDKTGYWWFIDYDRQLHFRERTSVAGSYSILETVREYREARVTQSFERYRNVQIVAGGYKKTDTTIIETQFGDGQKRSFLMPYAVDTVSTVEVDTGAGFTPATFGQQGVDEGKAFYFVSGEYAITQDEAETVLGATHKVRVTFTGRFPITAEYRNETEIAARAAIETGDGEYVEVMTDSNIDNDDTAFEIAEGLVRRFGEIQQKVSFTTDDATLEPGQLITVQIPDQQVDGSFLVDSVVGRLREDKEIVWSVTALSGESLGGWVEFFRRLRGKKNSISYRPDEVLLKIVRPNDDLTLADALTSNSVTPPTTTIGGTGEMGLLEYA